MRMSKRASKGSGHLARQRKQAGQGGDQEAPERAMMAMIEQEAVKLRAMMAMIEPEPAQPEGWELVTNLFAKVKTKVGQWVNSINV